MPSSKLMAAVMVALVVAVVAAGKETTDSSKDDNATMICAYPISGQYGTLSRVLYYILMVFACFSQRWSWPSIAALAYIMNYSATTAVHSFVLIVTSKSNAVDLDIFGAWAILSTASLAIGPTLAFSSVLKDSVYRPLFGYWGSFVSLGTFFSMVTLFLRSSQVLEAPCMSKPNGQRSTLLTDPLQLSAAPESFDCTYSCFNQYQAMRARDEVIAITGSKLPPEKSLLIWAILATISLGATFGFFACCLASDRKRTKAELEETLSAGVNLHSLTPGARRLFNKNRREAREELKTGDYRPARNWTTYASIPATVAVVLLNEVYILFTAGLPVNEKPYAVGQWIPLVTIALAFAAAAINDLYRAEWEKLQKVYEADKRRDEDRTALLIGEQAQNSTDGVELGESANP